MAFQYSPKIVTDGLVLYLDSGNSKSIISGSTTWTDLSRSGYNGILRNGPTYNSTNGGSILFDGSNDYIEINGIVSNNEFSWSPNGSVGNSSLCYELWFKSIDSTGYFISKPWNGSGQYNYYLTPTQFSLVAGTTGTTVTNMTLPNLSTNIWNHVVIWANSTTMGYYINGTTQSGSQLHNLNGGIPSVGNVNLPLVINSLYPYGEGWGGVTNFSISGNTSIVRKYNRVLSAQEVLQNYNTTKSRYGL